MVSDHSVPFYWSVLKPMPCCLTHDRYAICLEIRKCNASILSHPGQHCLCSLGSFKIFVYILIKMKFHPFTLLFSNTSNAHSLINRLFYFDFYCYYIHICVCTWAQICKFYLLSVFLMCVYEFRAGHFVWVTNKETHPWEKIILSLPQSPNKLPCSSWSRGKIPWHLHPSPINMSVDIALEEPTGKKQCQWVHLYHRSLINGPGNIVDDGAERL